MSVNSLQQTPAPLLLIIQKVLFELASACVTYDLTFEGFAGFGSSSLVSCSLMDAWSFDRFNPWSLLEVRLNIQTRNGS